VSDPQRFFFVHMQKTAGTALFQRLKLHLDRASIYPPVASAGTIAASIDVAMLERYFGEHRDELRVITGHLPLCVADLLGVPFSTFTVLRDPVERTLSFLRDNKAREPKAREMSLEAIYSDPHLFHGLIQNHMVKMLSLSAAEMTHGIMTHVEFDAERLELAKHNLAEKIGVVGLQDQFDDFCGELTRRYGLDLGPPRFANRTAPSPVPDGLIERIATDNELDVELYRFARRLCEERRDDEALRT
jgi:hypothetical protein